MMALAGRLGKRVMRLRSSSPGKVTLLKASSLLRCFSRLVLILQILVPSTLCTVHWVASLTQVGQSMEQVMLSWQEYALRNLC